MAESHRKAPESRRWTWTGPKERAALLLAEGVLSIDAIAKLIEHSESGIDKWKQRPEFLARIDEHAAEFRTRFLERGLANRERRLAALTDLYTRQQQVIEARAKDKFLRKVPGGASGLIVARKKMLGTGPLATETIEYEYDTGLTHDRREVLQQIAQELGQWQNKLEHSGSVSLLTVDSFRKLAADALANEPGA